jgi:hypothetical protein
VITVLAGLVLTGCGGSSDAPAAAPSPSPAPEAASTAAPDIVLPAGPLRELVPGSRDLPAGMVPILSGTGPRDVKAVAGYSADPAAAEKQLVAHGFRTAYVAQYADPASGHVLSVVVTRFATPAGATADLSGDLAGSAGSPVPTPVVGEQSDVRRQPLPQASASPGQLVTVRFRKGATTWLVAYGASPTADPAVAVDLARTLAARA